jgi:hypothetical protein
MTIRPSPVVALNRAIAVRMRGPSVGSKRSAPLPTGIASPRIPSTLRRLASLSCAAGGTRPRASTSEQPSHSRATRWWWFGQAASAVKTTINNLLQTTLVAVRNGESHEIACIGTPFLLAGTARAVSNQRPFSTGLPYNEQSSRTWLLCSSATGLLERCRVLERCREACRAELLSGSGLCHYSTHTEELVRYTGV